MNITEARELVERHDANQRRIAKLRQALDELKPGFAEAKTTTARLTVQVGPMEPTLTVDMPKHLAVALLTDDLKRLEGEQAGIAQRLAAVA